VLRLGDLHACSIAWNNELVLTLPSRIVTANPRDLWHRLVEKNAFQRRVLTAYLIRRPEPESGYNKLVIEVCDTAKLLY